MATIIYDHNSEGDLSSTFFAGRFSYLPCLIKISTDFYRFMQLLHGRRSCSKLHSIVVAISSATKSRPVRWLIRL